MQFGIASYEEGCGIRATLDSLQGAALALGVTPLNLTLNDCSRTRETVETAQQWAREVGAELRVDYSQRRLPMKEADNRLLQAASADILLMLNADVVINATSLWHLLHTLTGSPRPEVVIGLALPDPTFRAFRYRASAWQLKAAARLAKLLPKDIPRAEASFFGMWRSLYSSFRYQVGSGSIHDDVQLCEYVQAHRIPVRVEQAAIAYKVPAGTLSDFYVQTYRAYDALENPAKRTSLHLAAAAAEAALDPVGLTAYLYARAWAARERRRRNHRFGELWDPPQSTKR